MVPNRWMIKSLTFKWFNVKSFVLENLTESEVVVKGTTHLFFSRYTMMPESWFRQVFALKRNSWPWTDD